MSNILKRKAALVVGISLLIMSVAAGVAYGAIHNSLVVIDNSSETLNNISNNLIRFNIEIALWIVIIITDLLVCWGLWLYYKKESKVLSASTGILRLIYTFILAIAVSMLIKVTINIRVENYEKVTAYILNFENIWSKGLIVFGFHLIVLGIVALKETKIWGILLIIAGSSYALVHSIDTLFPTYRDLKIIIETILVIPMTVGELGFSIWLLAKGGKTIKASS